MSKKAPTRSSAVLASDPLRVQLERLRDEMTSDACLAPLESIQVHDCYRLSAENLLHYLCLRRHDLREVQAQLAQIGLSSLGRSEAATLAAVTAVIGVLQRLEDPNAQVPTTPELGLDEGGRLLEAHTEALFGKPRSARPVRIMVTLPSEAAHDGELINALIKEGMDCARINCAHDDPDSWRAMIEHVRAGEKALGRECKVALDLAGPKLRTGPIANAPGVQKVRPRRDCYGRVICPARVRLAWTKAGLNDSDTDACLMVTSDKALTVRAGDTLRLRDARGSKRKMKVVAANQDGCLAELNKTAYFTDGIQIKQRRAGKTHGRMRLTDLPPREQHLTLRVGDLLTLTADDDPVDPPSNDNDAKIARIGCTLPHVLAAVGTGDPVWFDDGKIGARVESASAEALTLRITQVAHASGRTTLASDKGINFPDSTLPVRAPTEEDIETLGFAAKHADIVEMSFANSAEDVIELLDHLERLDAKHLGVVLKIETRAGFENLPAMLLAGMRLPRLGVMIARGDLAVETGFERLAELQEEILCLCEAAHVPVIWATQVLESLAKKGAPARSEITDAAMSVRAECVMLNKGPYIIRAVTTLNDVLHRMREHRTKKRDLLRSLHVAEREANYRKPSESPLAS
ncbi:pyruvate kinase [Pseudomonas stutzeri]|uniref:pyruvate kinase n=1 Tax=Stutzerimonas stutzeri TaxID=316 RepID=UPI00190A30C2|nr:pyruvate kinase [Stutzerimonas stutzeri]MBK3870393.1 pyruvate kinase [Stutzerimonas stutzeri]